LILNPCYLLQALHFSTLLIANKPPRIIPFSSITSTAYSEQVGLNLHPPPGNKKLMIGERVFL